jgi:twitching motility protein PilT
MIQAKDLPRYFRAATWAAPEEIEAFVREVAEAPAAELAKLLPLLLDRSLMQTPQQHRARVMAFAALVERHLSEELFVPFVRALKVADPALRATLVALLPKVNSVPAHPELCSLLGAPEPLVRQTAAQVLKQVGGKTAFQLLSDAARDPNFPGRLETMDVLVPKAGHHSIPLLAMVIELGRGHERGQALKYLADTRLMAKDLPGALRAMLPALDDTDERVIVQAALSIAAIGSEDEYFENVVPRIDSPNVTVVKGVVDGLRKFSSRRSVEALARKMRLGPNAIRLAVLDGFEAIASEEVLGPLVEALTHKQVVVRTRASEVLSALAVGGKVELSKTILWLLRSHDVNVRRVAVEIAKKVGDPTGELSPKLLRHLRDEDWWVRERVMDALVEMAGQTLTRHMVDYLGDPSDVVRRYAIGGLVRLKDPRSLGALVRAAQNDTDWWVREQAIEAIGSLKDPRALPYLLDLLNRDPQVALACIQGLKTLGSREAAPHVAARAADPDPDVRLAVVQCLAELDERSTATALKPLENDDSFAVRSAVREILARWQVLEEVAAAGGEKSLSLLDRMLVAVSRAEADDLLVSASRVPYVKRLGKMSPLSQTVLSGDQIRAMLYPQLSMAQIKDLEALKDVDFSYEVKSRGLRFRAHVFGQMTGISAVFRIVKNVIPNIETLGLPPVVTTFGAIKNGLVLVGGPTGSGKSTTLAALIDYINRTSARHIITLEDPIEVVHTRKQCLINQREAGTHTRSFASALRSTLREDPDVLLVGEMRDLETISFAVTAAETGHLVFGTVHTVSADTTVDRLINAFPPPQQPQVRSMLAESLRAVVCQHLVRRKDGKGRAIAAEIMINNDAISNMIRKGKTFQLPSVVATSRDIGMQSMDSELVRMAKDGTIDFDEGLMKAIDKKAYEAGVTGKPPEAGKSPDKAAVSLPGRALVLGMARLDSFLRLVVEQQASDLHFHAGNVPIIRHDGDLVNLPFRSLSADETRRFLLEIMTPEQREAFEREQELDFAYVIEGLARFRVNAFTQSRGPGAVFRIIPSRLPTVDELKLPGVLKKLGTGTNGLVLVTGPTGSGKTTTLAAIINEINATSRRHVITVEDPIEFVHVPQQSVVTQRQVGLHTETFASALRSALRESPDVLVVGEMRDFETVSLALSAAETGVLVFGTLHTNSAAKAVDRIIDVCPDEIREQVRGVLSVLLKGVVAQHLCRRASGEGRIAALEILMQTYAISNMIRENKIHQIDGYLQSAEHAGTGMQALDTCLYGYVKEGIITRDEATHSATYPDTLRKLLSELPDDV